MTWLLAFVAAVTGSFGCTGGRDAETPTARMSAEQQILSVGRRWQAREQQDGFRASQGPVGQPARSAAPAKQVAVFHRTITTSLQLEPGATEAVETFELDERFKLDNGQWYRCQARTTAQVRLRYGKKRGEAALEVSQPERRVTRRCTPPDFPEPVLELPATTSRFRLRGDQLVGFEPVSEKRTFVPAL